MRKSGWLTSVALMNAPRISRSSRSSEITPCCKLLQTQATFRGWVSGTIFELGSSRTPLESGAFKHLDLLESGKLCQMFSSTNERPTVQ